MESILKIIESKTNDRQKKVVEVGWLIQQNYLYYFLYFCESLTFPQYKIFSHQISSFIKNRVSNWWFLSLLQVVVNSMCSSKYFWKKIKISDYSLQGKDGIFKKSETIHLKTQKQNPKSNVLWKQHWECLEMFSLLYDFVNENGVCLSLKFSYQCIKVGNGIFKVFLENLPMADFIGLSFARRMVYIKEERH